MQLLNTAPKLEDIQEAHKAIQNFIHRTPILTNKSINEIAGCEIFFKCENFQKIGAFKMRGASCAALALPEDQRKKGLATHSSGNHGQAVARAAKLLNVPAYIVMPENAPTVKKNAVKGYGAEVILCEPTAEARAATLEKVIERTGAVAIHPFDNYNVMAGQGTCAKEFIEDNEVPLDIIIAPISGGGLMSGTALTTHYLSPNTLIYGAEPELANEVYRSFISGKMETHGKSNTIADGLRMPVCENTYNIIKKHVSKILIANEEEIISTMRLIWERMKILIEASCAVPLAGLLNKKEHFKGKKVGIIITGGNIDLGNLPF